MNEQANWIKALANGIKALAGSQLLLMDILQVLLKWVAGKLNSFVLSSCCPRNPCQAESTGAVHLFDCRELWTIPEVRRWVTPEVIRGVMEHLYGCWLTTL